MNNEPDGRNVLIIVPTILLEWERYIFSEKSGVFSTLFLLHWGGGGGGGVSSGKTRT